MRVTRVDPLTMSVRRVERARSASSAQRSECRAQFGREELRLLPGGEVAATADLVEVREAGVDRLGPAARGGPDLAGKRREGDRNRDRRRRLAGDGGQESPELPVPA